MVCFVRCSGEAGAVTGSRSTETTTTTTQHKRHHSIRQVRISSLAVLMRFIVYKNHTCKINLLVCTRAKKKIIEI